MSDDGRTSTTPEHGCPPQIRTVVLPGDVWRCGTCGREWTWRGGGVWVPVIPTEPGVPSARVSRGSRAYWGAIGQPPPGELTGQERDLLAAAGLMPAPEPAPSAEHYRRGASELAHRIRDLLRAEHKRCRNPACALSLVWAEDVQEILDARDRLLAVCSCRPRESGEAPDVPERDCPVHGEGAL